MSSPHTYSSESPVRVTAWFVRDLRATLGWRLPCTMALILGASLVEATTLLLLVPVLGALGLESAAIGSAGSSGIGAALGRLAPRLEVAVAAFAAVACLQALLVRWQTAATAALDYDYVAGLRARLYRALARAPWPFIVERRTSDLAHALVSEIQKAGNAAFQLASLASAGVLTLVYIGVALWISPLLTAAASVLSVVPIVASRSGLGRSTRAGQHVVTANAALNHAAIEHLTGAKTTRSYGADERNADLFDRLSHDVVRANAELMGTHATQRAIVQIGSALLLALLVVVAVRVLALPGADVLVLLLVFVRLVPRIGALQAGALNLTSLVPAVASVKRLLAEAEAVSVEPTGSHRAISLDRCIDFDAVSYSYPRAARPALREVTLTIARGSTIGIAGASGSGKTTIADLLLGLLEPGAGHIRVDGVDLTRDVLADWRTRIGYVSQDTFLFHDTVGANLRWAHPPAGEDDLWNALRKAAADRFVQALPAGLDTVLGDGGVRLSGGERQRLALARAFLREPALLVLDEATSALDAENERLIVNALAAERGRLTVVLISHRLGLLRDADAILVLDEGCVVESGTWDTLMTRTGSRLAALATAEDARTPLTRS